MKKKMYVNVLKVHMIQVIILNVRNVFQTLNVQEDPKLQYKKGIGEIALNLINYQNVITTLITVQEEAQINYVKKDIQGHCVKLVILKGFLGELHMEI